MKCSRCGAANGDEQASCNMCFTPLKHTGETITEDNQINPISSNTATNRKTNPGLRQARPQRIQAGTRSGSKRPVVLVISLVIAAAFGIALWTFYLNPSPVAMAKKATRIIHTGGSAGNTADLEKLATSESKWLAAPKMGLSNMLRMMSQGKPGKFAISEVKKVVVQGNDAQVDLAIMTDMGPQTQHVHLVREGVFPLKRWKVDLKDTQSFVGMQDITKARGGMSQEQVDKLYDEVTEENRQMQEKIKRAQQGQ